MLINYVLTFVSRFDILKMSNTIYFSIVLRDKTEYECSLTKQTD